MTISIEDLEHAAAAGWRACAEDRLGSWLLRAARWLYRPGEQRARRTGSGPAAGSGDREGLLLIYLQVTDGNAGARALRRQLGFTDHHGYHYRVAPA